jgi:glutamate dehydrogenase
VLLTEEGDPDDRLLAVPGSGLGILRADQAQSGDAGRLPRGVRSLARQRQLVVVTKANSRSTVHRPAYLDYVGVKTFNEVGEVTGERRFLGLFTSAAYNQSIQRIPVLRRKAAEVLARSGFSSSSHSGKDLLQILETYPRDELFQIGSDDLAATALSVMHLQERRQLRLFLRRDAYGRFMSCMVYLPRDRYTTQVRHAMEAILLEAFDGVSIDYTALVSESVLARCTSWSGRPGPRPARTSTRPQVEAELVLATRSWDDDFADALRDSCGAGRRPGSPHLRRRVPRGLQGGPAGRDAVADLHRLEKLTNEATSTCSSTSRRRRTGDRGSSFTTSGCPSRCPRCCPACRDMGVEVVDERPYEIERSGRPRAWVYDFGLRYEPSGELPATTPGPCSRTPSPPSGRARPRATASTRWCCAPG